MQKRERLPSPKIYHFGALFKDPPPGQPGHGFLEGSTILVTGRPGAGKSFFALSLVREQIRAYHAAHKDERLRLLFVGVGMSESDLEERYKAFGWITRTDNYPVELAVVSVDETTLPQPAAGADELINPILTKLRKYSTATGHGKSAVFVVFDSLTSLVKGSQSPGERQRYIHEMVSLTKKYLAKDKKLCILTADATDSPDDGIRPERETAADFVFHLTYRESGGGRVARVLDVRKCPENTPLLIGQHSWEALHDGNLHEVIAPYWLRKHVLELHKDRETPNWGAIYISPHLSLPAVGLLQGAERPRLVEVDRTTAISCGIPGLDEMLAGDQDYWAKPTRALLNSARNEHSPGGLFRGSVTFLMGRAGTGKSNSCLQFLLASGPTQLKRCLYVNFENLFSQILAWYPGSQQRKDELLRIRTLYRRRSQFDFAHLAGELLFLIQHHKIERIAFDGLTDLASANNPQQFELLVEELVALVRQANHNLRARLEPPYRADRVNLLAIATNLLRDRLRVLRIEVEARQAAAVLLGLINAPDVDLALTNAATELLRVTQGPREAIEPGVRATLHHFTSASPASLRNQVRLIDAEIERLRFITIYIALETEPDSVAVARYEQKDSPADNVIVFRQVTINDERRKTVEVRKARGRAPDRQVREIIVHGQDNFPLRIVPGLDNYRRLADGPPEPVRVALQLIGENPTAVACNRQLTARLNAYAPGTPESQPQVLIRVCLRDAICRFNRLFKRVLAAIEYRAELCHGRNRPPFTAEQVGTVRRQVEEALATVSALFQQGTLDGWDDYTPWNSDPPPLLNEPYLDTILPALEGAGRKLRDAVLVSPLFEFGRAYERRVAPAAAGFEPNYPDGEAPTERNWLHLPYAMLVDVRDVLELLRWHDHRVAALRGAINHDRLGDAVFAPPATPPASTNQSKDRGWVVESLSGFACEGAWMGGADRTTRSPNLSAKFLTEITSLESTQQRAWLGAGIPARKDYYDQHGERTVPYSPHAELTWNQLLRVAGARSCRRSRTFCARVRVSDAFAELDRAVFGCLTLAEARREDYRKASSVAVARREELVKELTGAAAAAVRSLFEWVRTEMRAQLGVEEAAAITYRTAERTSAGGTGSPNDPVSALPRPVCVTCPAPGNCGTFLRPPTQPATTS